MEEHSNDKTEKRTHAGLEEMTSAFETHAQNAAKRQSEETAKAQEIIRREREAGRGPRSPGTVEGCD